MVAFIFPVKPFEKIESRAAKFLMQTNGNRGKTSGAGLLAQAG